MTNPFSNNPEPRTPEQIVADIETGLRQPWGLVPRREIMSPQEYRRLYEQEMPPP